jgi:hypothetical protein
MEGPVRADRHGSLIDKVMSGHIRSGHILLGQIRSSQRNAEEEKRLTFGSIRWSGNKHKDFEEK